MSGTADPTRRFSDRVADYVRYRPGYPGAAVDALIAEARVEIGAVVADVGSGTGIFADLLLARGFEVYAVEPNAAMREAAEQRLGVQPRFHSVAGTAEATGLPAASVDLVTAAQAFHWFDPRLARRELARILRPDGVVALVWNRRLTDATPFLREYEGLLQRHGTDYRQVDHVQITPERIADFYGSTVNQTSFANEQRLDFEALRGRLLSSSYTPAEGDPRREPMLSELREIFDRHAEEGHVRILYRTELHVGRLDHG